MSGDIPLVLVSDNKSTLVLNRSSGAYTRIAQPEPFRHGAKGFALEWRVGLINRRTQVFALFADESSLWLHVGSREFDLLDPHIRIKKSNAIPFLRRFQVWRSGECCVEELYWAYPQEDLSTEDDLPGFVASLTQNRLELLRTLLRYRALGDGKNVLDEEVHRNLEVELKARLAQDSSSSVKE